MLKNDDASRFLLSVATKGGNVPVPFVFLKMFLPWLNVATVVYSDYSVLGSHILYVATSWPEGILVVPFCMPSVFSF